MSKTKSISRAAVTLLLTTIVQTAMARVRTAETKRAAINAAVRLTNREKIRKIKNQILADLTKKGELDFDVSGERIEMSDRYQMGQRLYRQADKTKLAELKALLKDPASVQPMILDAPILLQYIRERDRRGNPIACYALAEDAETINKAIQAVANSVLSGSGLDLGEQVNAILAGLGGTK